ncbi:NIPSNAP family protein [Rubinisphaera italica]|uniref:NIPSNAP domain-containing protein n=1 Tax=Rubinisphaera italica TaxID=2527969 RepID=A0A5C5XFR9_9PLAN|nr:NIPSNAP family protein [Rubinisphaera italica]TWT61271.1 hypothetical protein Pan54_20070 [Rubinisphaera italica]
MKSLIHSVLLALVVIGSFAANCQAEKIYELRRYTAHQGKLDDLLTRFRDHTCELFTKHGMTNLAYFVPYENDKNQLVYFLSFPSREARDQSFKEFVNDPAWKSAFAKSREDGPLVEKVESVFLTETDFSPKEGFKSADDARLFELRTYTATPGHLSNLDARFRDHTIELFEKHGINNIAYFHLMPDQEGAEKTLVYLIAHKSIMDRGVSFKAFGQDPVWQEARKASEENAGGSLTEKGGVNFEFLVPTDFSPVK